jgi:cytosine/adenosine deaminase-related metal-dependent hydrolase
MLVLSGAAVATCDADGTEHASGYVVIDGTRIAAVGQGSVPDEFADADRIDATGRLITPGFVNTHHHLYQWLTRGYATDSTLFEWLTTLYPIWARMDEDLVQAAASANLAWLALTGCTTSTDHHYVFPRSGGDLLAAEIRAAQRVGLRFHPTRGSMNLGESDGGLPPDEVVEQHDAILAASAEAISTWHDPSFDSMLRIGLAPCSPFSVTGELMRDSAALAREHGVRLHTHLAETADEDDFCVEKFGRTPAEYLDDLGWLADDVWLAHCVHLSDDAIARFAATGTSVAHCPTSNGRLGAGVARTADLLAAGVPVGLGTDGSASNESGRLQDEPHQALLAARARGGPLALDVRQALQLATMGGARCLGRADEIGSLEPGKVADVAVWNVDHLGAAGIADPVCALVLGSARLDRLVVNGANVVTGGQLQTADADDLASAARDASATIAKRGS